jgi:hypothetical protein
MAYETIGERITQLAGADLTGKENLITKQSSTTDNTVILAAADSTPLRGVITQGATSGNGVTLQITGVAKVIAGAAVAAGALVTSDAAGKAVAVSATVGLRYVLGEALEAAAGAGAFIAVLLRPAPANSAVS